MKDNGELDLNYKLFSEYKPYYSDYYDRGSDESLSPDYTVTEIVNTVANFNEDVPPIPGRVDGTNRYTD